MNVCCCRGGGLWALDEDFSRGHPMMMVSMLECLAPFFSALIAELFFILAVIVESFVRVLPGVSGHHVSFEFEVLTARCVDSSDR